MNGRREYGDYQTPIEFAERVCRYLKEQRHIRPSAVVEPTCGIGNFLKSSLLFEAKEYYGIEIDPEYCEICRNSIKNEKVNIINSDFFSFSSKDLVKDKREILVIGNPPWVTNSTLSALGSNNVPTKTNFKGLRGLEAITGTSNFDICEYMILQIVQEYRNTNTLIAMLCKTSIARSIFKELKRTHTAFSSYDILEFNSSKVFGINASACILLIQLSNKPFSSNTCNIYDFEVSDIVKSKIEYADGRFCKSSDIAAKDFYGPCCFEWRQGIKHDCSKVMELTLRDGILQNGKGERIQIEDDIVFPLIKSSMFKSPVIHEFSKFVIVTQKRIREETKQLEQSVPKTWKYLNDNIQHFENRKSSVYRGAPRFSMFGVGDYSYSKYKVGVSGFYKQPRFSVLYSDDGKPVMTDDTSYYICFNNYDMAYVAMLLLNSLPVQDFLISTAFLDAKRPYTKKVLECIDFDKIVSFLSIADLEATEQRLGLSGYVTPLAYEAFKSQLGLKQLQFA